MAVSSRTRNTILFTLLFVVVVAGAVYSIVRSRGVRVFREEWSPDRKWGVRLCKVCNSVDGVVAWYEVIDDNLGVRGKEWLIGNYEDCADVDSYNNYVYIDASTLQIGERGYSGEIVIDVTINKYDVLGSELQKGFKMPSTPRP